MAWDFFRIRSRRPALIVLRSYMDKLVNFSIYVNLGYMHCFSICHIVVNVAFFFVMAYRSREISDFTSLEIVEELSGERKAPRTRVGDDRGIGAIVVFVPSVEKAVRVDEGEFMVK